MSEDRSCNFDKFRQISPGGTAHAAAVLAISNNHQQLLLRFPIHSPVMRISQPQLLARTNSTLEFVIFIALCTTSRASGLHESNSKQQSCLFKLRSNRLARMLLNWLDSLDVLFPMLSKTEMSKSTERCLVPARMVTGRSGAHTVVCLPNNLCVEAPRV